MRTLHRGIAGITIGLLAVGGLTACSNSKTTALPSDPKAALVASLTNLGNETSASVTISLKDPAGALLKAMSKDSTAKDIAIAKRVLAGSFKLSMAGSNGAKLGDTKAKHDFSMELIEGATTDFAISVISGDLYAHIDQGFLNETGGAKAVSAIKTFAPALATGGYIKIPGIVKAATDFSSGLTGSTSGKPKPSIDPQAISNEASAALKSAITVTKTANDVYGITVAVKPLMSAYVSIFSRYSTAFGGSAATAGFASIQKGVDSIPDGAITGTVTVNGNKASQIAIDLSSVTALVKKAKPTSTIPDLAGAQLLIAVGSSTSGLTVPAGATELNLASLFGKIFGAAGALGGAGGGFGTPQVPCSALPPTVKIPCTK